MMNALVRALKPLLLAVLRLHLSAPHLPEGTALVRHLKPADAWLGLRYAGVFVGIIPQLGGLAVATAVISATQQQQGALIALGFGFVFSLVGLAVALVITRIDFELRHYLVGDRSLRVSEGALIRREVTLSYANVQNLEVVQGPLERLFRIKSLMVSTAGGEHVTGRASTHQVTLAGLSDADQVRELILGMVKKQRDEGLGEPVGPTAAGSPTDAALLLEIRDAAVTLRDAARSFEMPIAARR
jgi:membrane protein YdbS with pleckstrin-like domain